MTSLSTFKDKGHLHDVIQRLVLASEACGCWKSRFIQNTENIRHMTLLCRILLQNSRPTITLPRLCGCCRWTPLYCAKIYTSTYSTCRLLKKPEAHGDGNDVSVYCKHRQAEFSFKLNYCVSGKH